MRCSAQTTPPLPPRSSVPPTIAAARHCAGPMGSRLLPPGQGETPTRTLRATRRRVAAIRNGGRVSIATRMARYVDPQTRYTVPSAAQVRADSAVDVACGPLDDLDMRRHLERERARRRKRTLHSSLFSLGYAGRGASGSGCERTRRWRSELSV